MVVEYLIGDKKVICCPMNLMVNKKVEWQIRGGPAPTHLFSLAKNIFIFILLANSTLHCNYQDLIL